VLVGSSPVIGVGAGIFAVSGGTVTGVVVGVAEGFGARTIGVYKAAHTRLSRGFTHTGCARGVTIHHGIHLGILDIGSGIRYRGRVSPNISKTIFRVACATLFLR